MDDWQSCRRSCHCCDLCCHRVESLLGETDVDLRRILEEARDEKGCAIFETFSTDGPSAFFVVSRSRWDKDKKEAERTMATKFVCFFK